MAVLEHTVVLKVDRSELDAALADLKELGEQLAALTFKVENLTLGVSMDMRGVDADD